MAPERFRIVVEDLTVFAFEITISESEAEAGIDPSDKADDILDSYDLDYERVMKDFNGQEEDGSLEIHVYELGKTNECT